MPQVNEISWFTSSFFYFFSTVLIMTLMFWLVEFSVNKQTYYDIFLFDIIV